jgi:hypothetical protein
MHPSPPAPDPIRTRRVALATLIGTSIEWYDFFIYGAAAALVFGKLFFPTANPLTGTLLALSTFGVGFVARPVGGVWWCSRTSATGSAASRCWCCRCC